jgi:hypothetical protein
MDSDNNISFTTLLVASTLRHRRRIPQRQDSIGTRIVGHVEVRW